MILRFFWNLQKWGDYPGMGEPLEPQCKFIPIKTPLSDDIISNWSLPEEPKFRLTVNDLLTYQAGKGRKVGMLLDLSNHDTLYIHDIPASLGYTHIQLVAKVLPLRSAVDAVIETAQIFWKEHPEQYIAIHCAYGMSEEPGASSSRICCISSTLCANFTELT